jgi:hypothetical protein
MLTENLKSKITELNREIENVEAKLRPLQEEHSRLQEYRRHAQRLLELEGGTSTNAGALPRGEIVVPRKPGGDVYWKAIADGYSYRVNGNSAHRVVLHRNPALHEQIAHSCTYDGRSYP